MTTMFPIGYHDAALSQHLSEAGLDNPHDIPYSYSFENFFHPYVDNILSKLSSGNPADIMSAKWQGTLLEEFFKEAYSPAEPRDPDPVTVKVSWRPKEIDVDEGGPYANYNWEIFFHIPVTVAVHLSKTRRFAEAERWFHYVFNPLANDESVASDDPKRFWNFIAFRTEQGKQIDYLLKLLSLHSDVGLSEEDRKRRENILNGYQAMLDRPFQPYAIARTRRLAYQYSVVMKYLDNLIAWGDDLFQQDTVETLNEATLQYVLAANILGPKPQRRPPTGEASAYTFAMLKSKNLDRMGNALVELENAFPFNQMGVGATGSSKAGPLFGIGRSLYFCIPRNDKLLRYWDTVADRLFKIRHCMNLSGVVRPIALFDPPIDPGMLVKAAAAGLDVGAAAAGLSGPVCPMRSATLLQKAVELCGEVRSLGAALLAAMEKGENEHLALVRQGHEFQIQTMTQEVKFLQLSSAKEATASLLTARKAPLERLRFYERILGLPADPGAPESIALQHPVLTEENFDASYAGLVGQYDKALSLQAYDPLRLAGAASPLQDSGGEGKGNLALNVHEDKELNVHMPTARDTQLAASIAQLAAPLLNLIPSFTIDLQFWGLGGSTKIFSGEQLAAVSKFAADLLQITSAWERAQGEMANRTATYERRAADWVLQHNSAANELMQNGRQILSGLIAEQLASHEYETTKQQIKNTQEIDKLLHDKFSNEDLYLWQQGELSRLFYEYYRFATETARRAERAMKQELMRPEFDAQEFVKFNYWDSGRKGLLSGEALFLDLKRLELAYHDFNKRELELVRHASLRQLSPLALLQLRTTGSCTLAVPEWLFDRDSPGHYMRRIKTVAMSIPSVIGPYTSIHCTLSLLRSSVRKSASLRDGAYMRQGVDDDRFVDYAGAIQSVVTSGANNDSGLFETNLRDERYLPFEGAGAVSMWKLDLPNPQGFASFDYATIADVVLHIRYTARQGIDAGKVTDSVRELLREVSESHLAILISLKQDRPSEWAAFLSGQLDFSASVGKQDFPYFAQYGERAISIEGLTLYDGSNAGNHLEVDMGAASTHLAENGQFTLTIPPDAAGVIVRGDKSNPWLIVRYSLA